MGRVHSNVPEGKGVGVGVRDGVGVGDGLAVGLGFGVGEAGGFEAGGEDGETHPEHGGLGAIVAGVGKTGVFVEAVTTCPRVLSTS